MDMKLRVVLDAVNRMTRPLKQITGNTRAAGKALGQARERKKQLDRTLADVDAFRKNRRQLDETRTALHQAQERTQALGRQLHTTERPTREMTRQFNRARRELHALQTRETEQARSLGSLRDRLAAAGVATSKLGTHERRLRTETDAATRSVEKQTARLRRLGNMERRMAAARERMDRTRSRGGALVGGGMGAAFAGGGALYAVTRFMLPGMDFQYQESRVKALARLKDNSAAAKMLHDQARKLGANTAFTATDAASGQAFLAMAGFTPKSIRAAMPGMLNLALAGGDGNGPMDLGETADIASNILSGMDLKANQMNRVADVLTRTTSGSNTDLRMLGETMSYVAPQAAALHVPLETAAAMAGKLGDAGIQASQAGTVMRAMLTRLAAPPAAAAKALKKLNIQTRDARGNLRSIPKILVDLDKATKGMGTADRAAYFSAIAGQRAVAGMTQLVKVAGSGELQKMVTDLQHSSGQAGRTASRMMDNAKGDIKALGSAWQDLGIQMFESENAPIRGLIEHVTHLVRSITAWTKANPELASTLVAVAAVLATVVAAAGALAVAVGGLLGPFAVARWAMTGLGIKAGMLLTPLKLLGRGFLWLGAASLRAGAMMLANPMVLIIAGIIAAGAALAFAAYEIYKHWAGIKAFFSHLWGSVSAAFAGAWKRIKDIVGSGVNWLLNKLAPLRHALHMLQAAWDRLHGRHAPTPPKLPTQHHAIHWITGNDAQAQERALQALTAHGTASAAGGYTPLSRRGRPVVHRQGDQITIQVDGTHDPHATAHAVRDELDKRDRERSAASRSDLYDTE